MMISPETYVDGLRDKSYKELLLEREQMLGYIKEFEEAEGEIEVTMYPTPKTVYQMNLEYLAKLCELIAEKYREEYVDWDE